MRYKKILILLCSLLFFLTALTFYLNRVIFPQLIKKIAVQQIETALKRKAEIGSIHFNWFKGIIIDKIKLYEKDSDQLVFAQADQVSFGFIIIPGSKHYKISVPFIHVRSPSAHLIRTAPDVWNFSDMQGASSNVAGENPSGIEISWGGITIDDGQCLIEDVSLPHPWSELFDNINLKLSLSYKGINYDLTADIPRKKGFVGATVYYQPLTQNTRAQIHLQNINTASYLSLINIPDVQLTSGIIKKIDLDIDYSQDKTTAAGDVLMSDLDMTSRDQTFKGNIEIHDMYAQYKNGEISAHGQMILNKIQTTVPGLSTSGNVQARVNTFELTRTGMVFDGFLHAQSLHIDLPDRQISIDNLGLDNIKLRKDKDGIQTVGSVTTRGLVINYPHKTLKGDITLKPMTLRIKDENNITLEGDLQAEKLSVYNMETASGHTLAFAGSLKTDKLWLKLANNILEVSTAAGISKGHLVLDDHKTIDAAPRLELTLQVPLDTPQQMTYKGSITMSDASIRGFALVPSIDNAELDADFQTDAATINALSVNILDTNVQITGTVKDFKDPWLDINAQADELNLSKIKNIYPQIVAKYGLTFDGTSSVKVKFNGLMSAPLDANILATASVKNVSIASSKSHQNIKNITGIMEATNDSLKLRDTTFTYLGKPYSLTGSLDNFKAPKIIARLNGEDIQLKADMIKNGNLVTLNSLTGKYLNADLDAQGTITFSSVAAPLLDVTGKMSVRLEDLINALPAAQNKNIKDLNPYGYINMTADLKGPAWDWKNYTLNADITSPLVTVMGYKIRDVKIKVDQDTGKIKNLTLDGKLYEGAVHAIASMDLTAAGMPYDMALNIDNTDLHELKLDSPFKMEEINGKFYLTTIAHGTMIDFKSKFNAKGSMAIREGFLAQFNVFKGLLGILNDAFHLGEVMITDVEANFTVDNQKINTDNLRLKSPSIVLLGKGSVGFDQYCDLDITVDLSSGVVPPIAQDVLNTLNIHVYDKISNPKFKRKISVPQVINTLFKNFL